MVAVVILLCIGGRHAAGLTINAQFDATITSATNALAIETTINEALRTYETLFSDPFTITIVFSSTNTGLGESSTSYQSDTYTDFLSKLTADATTASDTTALAHLPAGPNNPVNGNVNIQTTLADAKALGIFVSGTSPVATVYLNMGLMNVSRSGVQNPSDYDLTSVVEHEVDEVLGISSSLVNGSNGQAAPTGPINPIDLFRYDASGNRSYTTSSNAQAFLSIDGTTDLAQFNQISGTSSAGDFGDYNSYTPPAHPQVQDAYGTPGVILNIGTAEKTSLDVIGYNLLTNLTWDPALSGTTYASDGAGMWTTSGSSVWFNSTQDVAWNNGSVPNAQFGSTNMISGTSYTVTLGSAIMVGTLIFADQAYTLTSSSNALTINGGIIAVANAAVNAQVIMSGDNGWDVVGGAQLTVGGNVSGGFLLTKQGPGTLALSGSNSYGGGTKVQEGILTMQSSNALPSGGNVNVSGGALDLNGHSATIGNLTFGDGLTSIAASFQDSGATRGSATLNGNITYVGTAVNYFPAATISANLLLASGTHQITSADNYYANNYDIVLSGTMGGAGGIEKDGMNYVALNAANNYTGLTTVNNGWLFLTVANAIPSASDLVVNSPGVLSLNPTGAQTGITLGNYNQSVGSLSGNGQIVLGSATLAVGNNNSSTTFSGGIQGTGGLTKTGTGTLNIASALGYTGTTTINAGALEIVSGGQMATGVITGSSGGVLVYNIASSPLLANTITGAVGLTQAGSGTLFVSGSNSYTGTTTISGGYLCLGYNTSMGSLGTGSVVNNTGLYLYHSSSFILSNAISGSGFLFQQGQGAAILTGSNSYGGGVTIYSGTLQIGNGGTTGSLSNSTTVYGYAGTTLVFDRSDNVSFGNLTGGSMGVMQSGSGTLTLTAASNGYSGPTTVNSGTLLVSGNISGSTTTAAGGTVGGTGTMGAVSILSGAAIMGGSTGSVGHLSTGNLSLASGGAFVMQLSGTSAAQYDQVDVAGSVTLSGSAQISLLGFTPVIGETFYAILNDGTDAVSGGGFSNAVGNVITSGGWEYTVNYAANGDSGTSGNDVSFTVLAAIPEPGTMGAILAGVTMLAGCTRVRRRKAR